MTDPEQAHVEAMRPKGLSYVALAQQLGMKRGTLSRKLMEFNRLARKNGTSEIKPDELEQTNVYTKHYFHTDRLPEIRAALKSLPTKRAGRHKTPKQ
jgi:IS30 family transposase